MKPRRIFRSVCLTLLGLVAGVVIGREIQRHTPAQSSGAPVRETNSSAAESRKSPATNKVVSHPKEAMSSVATADSTRAMTLDEVAAAIQSAVAEKDQAKRFEKLQKIAANVAVADMEKA